MLKPKKGQNRTQGRRTHAVGRNGDFKTQQHLQLP